MRRLPVIAIVIAALAAACARAYVPRAELGACDGVYTLSGAGPPDGVPLKGMLTIANGYYVLDTSLGICKKQPLKVPKPWFGPTTLSARSTPTRSTSTASSDAALLRQRPAA